MVARIARTTWSAGLVRPAMARRSPAVRRLALLTIALWDVDDLPVGEPVSSAEPLAVAGGGLAAHFVRRDLRPLLDDDFLLAGGVRLYHRDLALVVHEVADAVHGEERDHQADNEDNRDVEEIGDPGERVLFERFVRRRQVEEARHQLTRRDNSFDAMTSPSSIATRSARNRCSRIDSLTQACRAAATT